MFSPFLPSFLPSFVRNSFSFLFPRLRIGFSFLRIEEREREGGERSHPCLASKSSHACIPLFASITPTPSRGGNALVDKVVASPICKRGCGRRGASVGESRMKGGDSTVNLGVVFPRGAVDLSSRPSLASLKNTIDDGSSRSRPTSRILFLRSISRIVISSSSSSLS